MQQFYKLIQWVRNNLTYFSRILSKTVRKVYPDQHQLTSVTSVDRYPALFAEAVKAVGGDGPLKILSFGCSTGEECFSLKKYFPQANVIGVDINLSNLKKAKRNNRFPDVEFHLSSPSLIERKGPYDLIFCLSVLCRWEDTKDLSNCEHVYPFIKFNSTIHQLSQQLKVNGLLVIYNSNFSFEDTQSFRSFQIVETPLITDSGFVTKFDRNNNVTQSIHKSCLYRKIN